jgi:hypothetical protein
MAWGEPLSDLLIFEGSTTLRLFEIAMKNITFVYKKV